MYKLVPLCILAFNLLFQVNNLSAQVGINIADPADCAILHINSDNKGVLLPAIANDSFINSDTCDGLLYYNTSDKKFKFFNEAEDGWRNVNPWNEGADGNVSIEKNVTVGKTINADIVEANTFIGYGTIPVGGIIMWSGLNGDWPENWKLCNGESHTNNGNTVVTPDLQNKFIIGASHAYGSQYPGGSNFQIDNSGGHYSIITNNPDNLATHGKIRETRTNPPSNHIPNCKYRYICEELDSHGAKIREFYSSYNGQWNIGQVVFVENHHTFGDCYHIFTPAGGYSPLYSNIQLTIGNTVDNCIDSPNYRDNYTIECNRPDHDPNYPPGHEIVLVDEWVPQNYTNRIWYRLAFLIRIY